MSRELKALLLNALVFPGSGHLYLNRRLAGWLLLCVFTGAFAWLMKDIYQIARQLADALLAGQLPLEPDALLAEVHRRSLALEQSGTAFYLMLAAWLTAVIDSLRLLVIKHSRRA